VVFSLSLSTFLIRDFIAVSTADGVLNPEETPKQKPCKEVV
jgi:hypothetical protein